ncbi:MAG: 50S ribosomal protein L31 [Candidatus Improbicoccus pseudotrichonymphae]|uniref:Large ribosomal subunit protein bL31 n=1 Tax=Candidatus Improbicoccus pseudotrichonymphae TaxID=3033792 RepID=A0AA48KWT2_9FIRM|nr:MAG: 50S ribosomal protein L31 [Candidatus Improbicoccus pseudotrichonymphae]
MKKDIHPKYGEAEFVCVCGNVIKTRSTKTGKTNIDICSACHSFFTGQQKYVDTAGRIGKFNERLKIFKG